MKIIAQAVMSAALLISATATQAQTNEVLDEVAVVVNNGVIMQSEIEQLMRNIKRDAQAENRDLPRDEVLRVQVTDRLVLQQLQMQLARRYGIDVTDAQLEQAINQIANEQNMTVNQMREAISQQGSSWAVYREELREEMIVRDTQRNAVRQRVYIAPQEIDNLVQMMDDANDDQVEYRLSHILIGVADGASTDAMNSARERAESVISRLNDGSDFEQMAVTASSGSQALEGGDLGWMGINEMPSLFAEVVRGKREGDIVGPLRSGVGFHILKIADTRGLETVEVQEVLARHILITPSVILSDNRAQQMLTEFYEQLQAGEAEFAELAKKHSGDPGSAARGGELGWANPETYTEAFKRTLGELEKGELSKPFRSEFGWHIVELLDTRVQDTTDKSKRERAYQLLYSRKYREELENWQQELLDQAYVEVYEK
ncbi:periplasmic chaperone for outer membrane proteins SurA [Pseudidiomarina planktonica]|uniref:Chaperone SurA n=1 Tax=Pseudidiomarina planktonica TaxID=1323738 RepID=A0A1Y6FY06_9GAMM|nr:peptidylprolyl isomerase SurA [Pseudidiomarina planktonica]RUO63437.1 peptidylprolyl isomerase SurA [Pseudidiomarina planktonica]SMQ80320.1 periplasmic chaperone for outer membrane proteins SurA [Pseudidiomarina planktonica]